MDERVAATFGDFSPSASELDVRSDSVATPVRAQRSSVQQTLAGPIQFRDVGLHSGGMVNLRLVPAPIDHGVRFFRTDLYNGARLVLPRAHGVTQTELCTIEVVEASNGYLVRNFYTPCLAFSHRSHRQNIVAA